MARRKFWNEIYTSLEFEQLTVNSSEFYLLKLLKDGCDWENFVSLEWFEIYGALYDETNMLSRDDANISAIQKDIHRTYSAFSNRLSFSNKISFKLWKKKYYEELENALFALTHQHNYCQGMNFIVAALILSGRTSKTTFILFSFLLKQRHTEILFNPKCSCLQEYMKLFDKRLRKELKNVYYHFKAMRFQSIYYLIEWYTTFFTLSCPGDFCYTVFDMLFAGFNDIMIRISVSIIGLLQNQLLLLDEEELMENFKKLVIEVDIVKVIQLALRSASGSSTNKGYDRIEMMAKNIEKMGILPEYIHTCYPPSLSTDKFDDDDDDDGLLYTDSTSSAEISASDSECYDSFIRNRRTGQTQSLEEGNQQSSISAGAMIAAKDALATKSIYVDSLIGPMEITSSDIRHSFLDLQLESNRLGTNQQITTLDNKHWNNNNNYNNHNNNNNYDDLNNYSVHHKLRRQRRHRRRGHIKASKKKVLPKRFRRRTTTTTATITISAVSSVSNTQQATGITNPNKPIINYPVMMTSRNGISYSRSISSSSDVIINNNERTPLQKLIQPPTLPVNQKESSIIAPTSLDVKKPIILTYNNNSENSVQPLQDEEIPPSSPSPRWLPAILSDWFSGPPTTQPRTLHHTASFPTTTSTTVSLSTTDQMSPNINSNSREGVGNKINRGTRLEKESGSETQVKMRIQRALFEFGYWADDEYYEVNLEDDDNGYDVILAFEDVRDYLYDTDSDNHHTNSRVK